MTPARDEQQDENRAHTGDPGLAGQDVIITEDGEIIPRRTLEGMHGEVIFEEPSLG